jgi:hypothetical protein
VIDVSRTVLRFATAHTLRRPGAATYVDGRPDDAVYSSSTIRAVVQPAAAGDMRRLPEGDREDAAIRVFSTSELRVVDVASGTGPDVIVYQGVEWEFRAVDAFDQHGAYWDGVAIRRGQ